MIPKLSRIKRTAFLISLVIFNDSSAMQFRLTFKGHFPLSGILRAEWNVSLSCDFSDGTN